MGSDIQRIDTMTLGTLVYIVRKDPMMIVPAKVNEKVTCESVQGVTTTYMLDFGVPGQSNISSNKLRECDIVSSIGEAEDILRRQVDEIIENTRRRYEDLVSKTVKKALHNEADRFGDVIVTRVANDADEVKRGDDPIVRTEMPEMVSSADVEMDDITHDDTTLGESKTLQAHET